MSFLGGILKAFSPRAYIGASVRTLNQERDGEPRPFSMELAVAAFQSWVYAAATINANGVASVPLRLYVRRQSSGRKLVGTRPVSHKRREWLTGEGRHSPSRAVMCKAMEFGDDVEEVVGTHPLTRLLHEVNPWNNAFDFMALHTLNLELTGNAYVHPVLDKAIGVPVELWPMPSQWTWVVPSETEFIKGYLYGMSREKRVSFAPDEVVHTKLPNPANSYYGKGWVEGVWSAIEQNYAAHNYDLATWRTHARPDYLLVVKGSPKKDELARFQLDVEQKLTDKRRRSNFLPVSGDVTIQPLNFPPKDMTGREEIAEEIAAGSGVPISMLMANDPNLASSKTGYGQWREATILPRCRLTEQSWNASLVPMFGDDLFLAFDNPVPKDEAADVARWTAGIGKWQTTNEIRAEAGYDPVDGGDELYAPTGAVPLDMARANAEAAALAAENAAKNPPNPDGSGDVEGKMPPDAKEEAKAAGADGHRVVADGDAGAPAPRRKAAGGDDVHPGAGDGHGGDVPAARRGACACGSCGKARVDPDHDGHGDGDRRANLAVKATTVPGEDAYGDSQVARIARMLGLQREQVAALIESVGPGVSQEAIIAALIDPKFVRQLNEIMRPILRAAVEDGARAGAAQIGVEFDAALSPKVTEALARRIVQLRASLNQTTLSRATQVVREGLEAGKSTHEIAADIRAVDPAIDKARAETIARTESARAYTAGTEAAWQESGVVTGKQWLLAPDPCEFCEKAAAQWGDKAQTLGAPFYAKGTVLTGADGSTMTLDYEDIDGPPLHPQCRCSMIPVVEGAGQ